jgi:hypothetical protein
VRMGGPQLSARSIQKKRREQNVIHLAMAFGVRSVGKVDGWVRRTVSGDAFRMINLVPLCPYN